MRVCVRACVRACWDTSILQCTYEIVAPSTDELEQLLHCDTLYVCLDQSNDAISISIVNIHVIFPNAHTR